MITDAYRHVPYDVAAMLSARRDRDYEWPLRVIHRHDGLIGGR